MEPLIINACLTGMVPQKKDTPHVPISPEEIIADADRVVQLGATVLHLHAREPDGVPTWRKEVYERIIVGIREIHPKVIICVSTSGRNFPEFEKRTEVLELTGDAKPDFASLTLGSLNFPRQAVLNEPEMIKRIASKMQEYGIRAEWEVFEPGMIHFGKYLVERNLTQEPRWVNILLGSLGTSPATPEVFSLITNMCKPWRWAATGVGTYQLTVNMMALAHGGHIRVGLEDSIWMDTNKSQLATNQALVERIVTLAKAHGRAVATIEETRNILK